MSGTLVIPNLQEGKSGVFVWPGLQGGSVALQVALSSSSLTAQALSQGTQVDTTESDPIPAFTGGTLDFDIHQINPLANTWVVTIIGQADQDVTMQTFTLPPDVSLNRAVFAVQVTGVSHDFTVSFNDLTLTSVSSPAATWCSETGSNGYGATTNGYNVTGATAFGTECFIKELVLPGTA